MTREEFEIIKKAAEQGDAEAQNNLNFFKEVKND